MIPVVVALALAAKFFVLQSAPTSDEENVYRFSAQALTHGRLALHTDLPRELLGPRWGWLQHGEFWAGIYPYGWPALLALGYLMRIPWLLNPLLAGLALWLAIGSNSILAYLMAALLMPGFKAFANVVLGNLKPLMGDYSHNLLMALSSYGLAWALLVYLRRQRLYLRL